MDDGRWYLGGEIEDMDGRGLLQQRLHVHRSLSQLHGLCHSSDSSKTTSTIRRRSRTCIGWYNGQQHVPPLVPMDISTSVSSSSSCAAGIRSHSKKNQSYLPGCSWYTAGNCDCNCNSNSFSVNDPDIPERPRVWREYPESGFTDTKSTNTHLHRMSIIGRGRCRENMPWKG